MTYVYNIIYTCEEQGLFKTILYSLHQDFQADEAKDSNEADQAAKNPKATGKRLERKDSDEENKVFHDGKKKNPKVRDEDRMFVNLGLIDLVNVKNDALMKIIKPRYEYITVIICGYCHFISLESFLIFTQIN